METKKAKLLIDFCSVNDIDLSKFCPLSKTPEIGDFHFTNGTYSSQLVEGRYVDGIYIGEGCSITRFEGGKMSGSEANEFCRKNNVKIPDSSLKDEMLRNKELLNSRLKQVGWPAICTFTFADYWSTQSQRGSTNRIRGFIFTGERSLPPTEEDVTELLKKPQNSLRQFAELLGISTKRSDALLEFQIQLPKAGQFLLENDGYAGFSEIPSGMHIKGIFLDCNTYISLDMENKTVCFNESHFYHLPKRQDIELLDKAVPQVDYALSELGLDSLRFHGGVLENCWYDIPVSERFPGEKRRLIHIYTWSKLSNAEKKLLGLKSILL